MASQVPPASDLKSWEDAFQHPLPVVRRLEVQLRKNIDDNRSKLRSLVGASYRDLLGTAERIIDMDRDVQQVEHHLSDIGRKCNARAVERAMENEKRLSRVRSGREEGRLRNVAQTKVLQSALAVVSRMTKRSGDALVAAKLLVLARLLHKSVSENRDPLALLEELRRRLGGLRKRLLSYIERSLVNTDVERTILTKTLCAYALVTSSAPKDVLRHFLQARYEQLEAKSEMPSEESLLLVLELYSQTLLDTKDLFPRRFAEALSQLAKVPLLQDEQVRSMPELNLDVYEQWLADDVRTFTPWVRHDQLTISDVGDGMASWAKQARDCLLHGLKHHLAGQTDAQSILVTRQKVVSSYLTLGSKVRDRGHLQSIDELREAFSSRLREIIVESAASMEIALCALGDLDEPSLNAQQPDLWSLSTQDIDLTNGATDYRNAIISSRHGRNSIVQSACGALDAWVAKLDSHWSTFEHMRSMKWDDELDFDLDDLEDLEDIEALQTVLSKRDPERLQDELKTSTANAFHRGYRRLEFAFESSQQHVASLIRVLRELEQRRRALGERAGKPEDAVPKSTLTSKMYYAFAEAVCREPLQVLAKSSSTKRRPPTALWDGSPPLPTQPSSLTFKFLIALQRSMSYAGDNLWSPEAVRTLKAHLGDKLTQQLSGTREELKESGEPVTNGHTGDEAKGGEERGDKPTVNGVTSPVDVTNKDGQVQLMFDVLYLDRTLTLPSRNSKLSELADYMKEQLELDESSHQRLRKSANEYWKRTYLLFGLLASDST